MFDERMESVLESLKIPNTYWKGKTYEYRYWFRSLLEKIDSCIQWKNLPETWPQDFFQICLFSFGSLCVFKSERFGDPDKGVCFFPAWVSQYDFYMQPVKAIVANHLYHNEFTIHKNCEMIKLTPDCYWKGGCLDIIDYYATKLAELSKGIDMGIINAKFPMCALAYDQAGANQLRAIYDQIQAGESLILFKEKDNPFLKSDEIIPHKEPFFTWQNDLKNNYIVTELLENMQTILNSFYMEIGLPVANVPDKRSHLLQTEADMQSKQSQARLQTWLTTLNESLELVNKMFDLKLEVDSNAFTQQEDDLMGSRTVSESDDRR